MMKKTIIILLFFCILVITACGKTDKINSSSVLNKKSSSFSAVEITKENKAIVEDTAKLLTKALARSTKGFSNDPKNPTTILTLPNGDDPNTLYSFIALVMAYHNPKYGYENSIYSGSIYCDENFIYHIKKDMIYTLLEDVINNKDCDLKNISMEYDENSKEYTSGLAFGIGYNWACDDILDVHLDYDNREVAIDYNVKYLFADAVAIENEITEIVCRNVYSIKFRENGKMYLRVKTIEVKD